MLATQKLDGITGRATDGFLARRRRRSARSRATAARETMHRDALPPANERVEIVRAELGTAAGVIGAALVAYDELG